MRLINKLTLPAVLTALLASAPYAATLDNTVVAVVNGKNITAEELKIAAAQSKMDPTKLSNKQKKVITEALVNRQLVLEEALKSGFDKDPEVASRVKALTESYIAANYLGKIAKSLKVDEKELKTYYEQKVSKETDDEFKARHILVKTEDEAKAVIKEIEGGADFSKVAKEKSKDSGSGAKGGDLGWFSSKDMVPAFSKAVAQLKKGEMSKTPIQTQFGWHVILLDSRRDGTPPTFDSVKQSIEKQLLKEKLTVYLKDLNAKAKIEIK